MLLKGKVITIFSNKISYIKLEGNKEISEENLNFDYLILALGSVYIHPFQATLYERNDQISSIQDSFNKAKNAKNILIVGGGAVGVELAG